MDDWPETDLAWELAEIACLLMPERDRIDVYTTIGAVYSYTAIGTLLKTIDRADVAISSALAARLAEWLSVHVHHRDAPRLHKILDSIRSAG